MEPSQELLAILEYRLRAVAIGHLALRHSSTWDEVPEMQVYFAGLQVIEGKATGFTNGAIEAAVIHCRALLEFLGLGLKKDCSTNLRELNTPRKLDDIAIEHVEPLHKVTINQALASYTGPPNEAEAALAYVVYCANKGLAHISQSFSKQDEGTRLLEIAFRGIPEIVITRFYLPLNITPPQFELSSRHRKVAPQH
jgi:hypothetical protein